MDATPEEIRVLGCLIEKQRTTPDQYPLSINSLRLACNQTTNREPVVEYTESDLRDALESLSRRRWVRLASGPGSRAAKYRHLFDEAVGLSDDEISLLAVLMLRGPQTVGELKARTERLHRFESLPDVEETLRTLSERELVERQARRPGQKEERWAQLLGGDAEAPERVPSQAPPAATAPTPAPAPLQERVEQIEAELADLRRAVESLQDAARET